MKVMQAYQSKFIPTPTQERKFRRTAGCCRWVYNKALELQKNRFENGEKKLSYPELCKALTGWRGTEETRFLSTAPTHPLQQSLKDLERAHTNFFEKRASLPKFKKRGDKSSFRYPDPKQVKLDEQNERIYLPKIGWVRYHKSRDVIGTIKQVTVSERADEWYLSVQTEKEVETPVHPSTSMVGIDLGIVNFAVLSDGTKYQPVNSYRKSMKSLAHAQRDLSRKEKGSTNRRKAKLKVQRKHKKVADSRNDFLHKTSTEISKTHAIIVIEDLQVRNMSRSAAGTITQPGKNVKAKSGLNRSILDQGWGEFRRQLEYKQKWRGGLVIAVPPHHTSQRCAACGCVNPENRISQSQFQCIECKHTANADLNAARNILAAGRAVSACGEIAIGQLDEARTHRVSSFTAA
jgi:putative transposase